MIIFLKRSPDKETCVSGESIRFSKKCFAIDYAIDFIIKKWTHNNNALDATSTLKRIFFTDYELVLSMVIDHFIDKCFRR